MPALNPSTPGREARRAALVALAAFAGAALWIVAGAARPAPAGPLAAFALPEAAIAPKAWALDPAAWHGWARLPFAVRAAGTAWVLQLAAFLCGAAAVLGIVHPGAFRRPSPYYLTPLRRATAYATAAVVACGVPRALHALAAALVPDLTTSAVVDTAGALRLAAWMAAAGAGLWTLAGPGAPNLRALVRSSHGALGGLAVWAACALAVLLAAPLRDVGDLTTVGIVTVAADAGRGAPGATFGSVLTGTLLVYGLGLALAGALMAVGAPQSMGARPRFGAAGTAVAVLLLLLGAGRAASHVAAGRVAAAAPDVVAALRLASEAPPRPVVLLLGDAQAARRVPPWQALAPLRLEADCAPAPTYGTPRLPAASEENLAALDAWRAAHPDEVSGLAARVAGCRIAILARLFRPREARAAVFDDPRPARVGSFALSFALRSLEEGPPTAEGARWVRALADTARWSLTAEGRERLARWGERADAAPAGVVAGRLDVAGPAAWRVGLAAGADPASGADPWLLAPRNDGQALLDLAQAVAPGPDGAFAFRGVAPGWYQLALLAPPGTEPARLRALSVRGDPAQFSVAAGPARRDLGTIHLSFPRSTTRPRSETP